MATLLLTVYGTEVCPYIEALPWSIIFGIFAVSFFLADLVRRFVLSPWVNRQRPIDQPAARFKTDLILFAGIAVGTTFYNFSVYSFPLGSGMKVLIGAMAIGIFVAIDSALQIERKIIGQGYSHNFSGVFQRKTAFLTKFSGILATLFALVLGVVTLIVVKDFDWLVTLPAEEYDKGVRSVFLEFSFIFFVLAAYAANALHAFGINLNLQLGSQVRVLDLVGGGNFSQKVPVASRDEFGQVAYNINQMIDGLVERSKFESVLGKVVSPQVARKLMNCEGTPILGGARQELVILFSDIRNFTTRSETDEPEVIVHDLNIYFSEMVKIVHEEKGLVDKFMGDGLMAVFGLDEPDHMCESAIAAANKMLARLESINERIKSPVDIGIGIHKGIVIAGNIGSEDRLEFTFIGDAVNTAMRLESSTKSVGAPCVISTGVFDSLPETTKAEWVRFGDISLKGKAAQIEVFKPAITPKNQKFVA